MIGYEQRILLCHVHTRQDGRAAGELLLRAPVLVEEVEVVGLVGLRLLEVGLPLLPHHVRVVATGLASVDAGLQRR